MAILNLPYQDIIERESGPLSEGFDIIEVSYSSKVSQIAFKGPSVEASRTERWRVFWKLLKKDVDGVGVPYSIDTIRDFYRLAQTNKVRWKPFELEGVRIWGCCQTLFL